MPASYAYRTLTALVLAIVEAGCAAPMTSLGSEGVRDLSVEAREHFLFTPTSDAESLLGRRMLHGADGLWSIAEERAPGCIVERATRVPAAWKRREKANAQRLIGAAVELPKIASFKAAHEASSLIDYEVQNEYVLRGAMRGPCGDDSIAEVNVGSGRRSAHRLVRTGADVAVAAVKAGAQAGRSDDNELEIRWDQPQAWSVLSRSAPLELAPKVELRGNAKLLDGDTVDVRVYSDKKVWLIVYYEESDGQLGVLLPNANHSTVTVVPGQGTPLPTIEVSLRDHQVATSERLVVYAFVNQAEYDEVRPPPGIMTATQTIAFVRRLSEYSESLPSSRYAVTSLDYSITPVDAHVSTR